MGDAAAHAVWVLAKSKTGLYPDGRRVEHQSRPLRRAWKGHAQIR
jgi:hypothetical protein